MEENVKNQLDQLGNIIDEKIEKAAGQALESANGKADEALKGEINNLTAKFNERFDALEVANKKMFEKKNESKDFRTNLKKALNEGAIEGLVKGNTAAAKFEIKADMTMNADFTGEVVPADRVPGYKFDPNRPQNLRQIIPNGSTGSDVVRFVKESGYSNGAAAAAEGATRGGGGATFGGAAVERGDGEPLRPRFCGDGPRLHLRHAAAAGLGHQPLGHPHPLHPQPSSGAR